MTQLSGSPALKVQVMCEGIRYTAALGAAAAHSMPNYYPYRFKEGEHDPTGRGITTMRRKSWIVSPKPRPSMITPRAIGMTTLVRKFPSIVRTEPRGAGRKASLS